VRRVDADNFDRVTAKVQDWVASQSTKRNASTTNHQEGDGTQSRTRRHTKPSDAADLKSELIKAGGSALVKLLLKLVNCAGNWRPCPQRGRKVIVNLL
jgi:hypothetical protein